MTKFNNGDLVSIDNEICTVIRAYSTKVRVKNQEGETASYPISEVELVEDELVEQGLTDIDTDDVELDEEDEGQHTKMGKTLAKYRKNYKPMVAASGRKSLSNGDELASVLEYKDHDQVVALAEVVLGLRTGELMEKYQHLNNGSKRMNAGNRIRGALKRGDITIEDIKKAL